MRVRLIPLVVKQTIVCPLTATWADMVLGTTIDGEGFNIEDIVAFLRVDNASDVGYELRVTAQYSNDAINWTDFPNEILAGAAHRGNKVSAAYTDRTSFGLHVRFRLGVFGPTLTDSAVVSAWIAVKFW